MPNLWHSNCTNLLTLALKTKTIIDLGFDLPILNSSNVMNIHQYTKIDDRIFDLGNCLQSMRINVVASKLGQQRIFIILSLSYKATMSLLEKGCNL